MPDQLKEKLQNYEVPPPPGVWAAVSRELREANKFLSLSEKMYGHEVTPPPNAWNRIKENIISAPVAENLAPVRNLRKPLYRVTVAAAVVGVVLLGSLYFFNNNILKKNLSPQTSSLDNSESQPQHSDSESTAAIEPESDPAPQIAATYPTHRNKRSVSRSFTKALRNATIKESGTFGSDLSIMIAAKPIRDDEGEIIQDVNIVKSPGKKYINVTGPNGQQTRISSKFLNALLYMNDDSNIESYEGYFDKAFVESLVWKSRFEEWRKKIIQTSFIPSSTNYLDILEFKDLILKEKEN